MIKLDRKGFTIIELLLSTAFFTVVMLMVVAGYVQINRSYVRGLTTKEVQNASRAVVDDISRAIRDADNAQEVDTSGLNRLCFGQTRYVWNQETDGSFSNVTFSDTSNFITLARSTAPASCTDPIVENQPTTEVLLDERLEVQYLDVSQIGTTDSFRIKLVISTKAQGLLEDFERTGEDALCAPQRGDEFCDVATLETVVTVRN